MQRNNLMLKNRFFVFFALLLGAQIGNADVPVSYQLPVAGPLPKTYRVTLAIVDAKNPNWIISQFAAGAARTVTAENGGKFSENWNGLDDNFMPVPPGDYAVKGIYMPAEKWQVDGEFHSITPRFAGGASPWLPAPADWQKGEPFGGDPVGAPLGDVAVGPNGVAVFYYTYLENGLNNPLIDLKKPLGPDQFVRAFNSGGAGGGPCAATDGETVWAYSTDGGPKYVYRADGKSFGKSEGANRGNSYLPDGWVTAMATARDAAGKSLVFVAQRGKVIQPRPRDYRESDTEFVDKITVHDGETGKVLAELPLARPQGLAVLGDALFALHKSETGFVVSETKIPGGAWQRVFAVPQNIAPADLEVDAHGRFYLSDSAANKVFQLDQSGKVTRTFGHLSVQKPGAYDRETFMAPHKLATWTTAQGEDRLLVVEDAGPNRVSEWSADGKFVRDFMSLQTKANDGYAADPENPSHVYLPGQRGWLTRFKVDYTSGVWAVDAVWPFIEDKAHVPDLDRVRLVRRNGQIYLCGRRSFNVYRLENERCVLSAAILQERKDNKITHALWHDANGNGRVDDGESEPTQLPGGLLIYHGQNWMDDLSFLALNQGGRDLWRLAPANFDAQGNPVFKTWQKVLSDPVFEARAANKADAVHGGNELAENFSSDWMGADGSLADGFWVQARGGRNFSANEGAQHKISRYVPDGKGGYKLLWRTGRTALQGIAQPGEMYGAMRIQRPMNGLISVVDQSRCGVLLFNADGLFVDAIFADGRKFHNAGLYKQGGEFFAGALFSNKDNGKIYAAMGKYTPLLYEMQGWSLTQNPVKPLTTLQKTVTISAAQITAPPEIALSLRGGAGTAKIARFSPALGGPSLDGSLRGWESAEPVRFAADKDQSVEVRCLYDPQHLYLRWHARLSTKFEPKTLPPLERIFTHDQLADTLSFYVQGDVGAKPGGAATGRPGDARFVFGIFKNGGANGDAVAPVALGMYPEWQGTGARPQVYRTPVGQAAFAHAGPVSGAKLAHNIDADGKGFVLTAAIPRSAIPRLPLLAGSLRTQINFSATFGGHNKFWWANSDGSASRETFDEPTEARLYPGSWAPAQFAGLEDGVTVRNWLICGPFGGPGAEQFRADPNGNLPGTNKNMKDAVREFCEAATYPPDDQKVDTKAVFTGEQLRGYWNDPREVRWKAAEIADLDTRVVLGSGAQTWYAASWVYAPAATELEFQFQSHPQTFLRWFLNGEAVKTGAYKGSDLVQVTSQTLNLRAGWNQIFLRGYCVGYPMFRAGLVLKGAEDKLWPLQFSATPPVP